jgi:hypothetical protein
MILTAIASYFVIQWMMPRRWSSHAAMCTW